MVGKRENGLSAGRGRSGGKKLTYATDVFIYRPILEGLLV